MARRLFLLAVSLLLAPAVLAQQPTCPSADAGASAVVGRVLEAESRVPMGFAHLELRRAGVAETLEARSDAEGYYQFCTVPAGSVSVWGTLGQFSGGAGPVSVGAGESVELTIELRDPSQNTGTLAGEIVDADTDEPVEGVVVFIRNLGLSALTNQFGRFAFPSVPPGTHVLRTERIGYAEAEGPVKVESWRATETRVSLATKAVSLDPIVVTAVRRRVDLPDIEDFERRYYSGWGEFVLEDEIQMRNPTKLTDVLTGTRLDITGNGNSVKTRRTNCAPTVYIDGVKVTHLARVGGGKQQRNRLYAWPDPSNSPEEEAADAINMINPHNILAVEVYSGPASTPGQYIDSDSRCGVVLIWSRRGR